MKLNQLRRALADNSKTERVVHLLEGLDGVPPVELLVYAIRAILALPPAYTQLHDLVRLLSMVEFWRLRAMSLVSTALVWQTYHKQALSKSTLLLTKDDEALFRDHDESNVVWREIFINIVAQCISTHLLRLWLQLDSTSHALFFAYWNEYFSALENPFPRNHPQAISNPVQPFHHRLSISDIDQLLASLHRLANFICPSLLPEDHLQDSDHQPEPSSTLDNALIQLVDDYLQYVPSLVDTVHNLFPDKFPLPWSSTNHNA